MSENNPTSPSGNLSLPHSRFFFIDHTGGISTLSSLKDGLKAVESGGYLWLDYCDPDLAALQPLVSELNIHPLSIEDALNEDQLPKLDLFPNYSFMIFNIFESSNSTVPSQRSKITPTNSPKIKDHAPCPRTPRSPLRRTRWTLHRSSCPAPAAASPTASAAPRGS